MGRLTKFRGLVMMPLRVGYHAEEEQANARRDRGKARSRQHTSMGMRDHLLDLSCSSHLRNICEDRLAACLLFVMTMALKQTCICKDDPIDAKDGTCDRRR